METGNDLSQHQHYLRVGGAGRALTDKQVDADLRSEVEPWLSAILQSEHLSLLVGSGFPLAVAGKAGIAGASMQAANLSGTHADAVNRAASEAGERLGRSAPNIEDQIRSALALIAGLEVLGNSEAEQWKSQLRDLLGDLTRKILAAERGVKEVGERMDDLGAEVRGLVISFLLTFASRAASRERLHLFTTNYDRFVEWGCDLAGLRPLDRFVGALEPRFRASRLDVDLHYNPPGIRGEPRYLEGVLRLTKLHGSLDWWWEQGALRTSLLPFGAAEDHPSLPSDPLAALMVYPNPAKDVETLEFPYSELFRDFSAALCRPNSALVTYGYGFGDDHINRVIADMLSIPSTHLVVMSYDWADSRIPTFLDHVARQAQVSLLVGPKLGDLSNLVENHLPKPAIDIVSLRRSELLRRRDVQPAGSDGGDELGD